MKYKILILTILCSLYYTASQAQWKKVFDVPSGNQVHPIFCYGNNVIAHNDNGAYLSLDNCKSWQLRDSSIGMQVCLKIINKGSKLFAGAIIGGVYSSIDSGKTWVAPSNWPYRYTMYDIDSSGSNILASMDYDRIILSKDSGQTWDTSNNGLPLFPTYMGTLIGTANIGQTTIAFHARSIYASYDHGAHWHLK